MRLALHNWLEDSLMVCGIPLTDARAAEPWLQFAFAEDWEYEEGDTIVRCKTNNTLATVNVNLFQASLDNDKLSALRILDHSGPGGRGVGPFLYKDANGSTKVTAPRCWIHKAPDFEVAKKTGVISWDFRMQVDQKAIFIGGKLSKI